MRVRDKRDTCDPSKVVKTSWDLGSFFFGVQELVSGSFFWSVTKKQKPFLRARGDSSKKRLH